MSSSKSAPEKPRDDWYLRRSAFPLRDALPLDLEAVWRDQLKFPRATGLRWREAGPTNYAGRVTSLAVDPANPNTIYAGSAAGGLWRTADQGRSWHSIWPKYLNQNIGAVALDPLNPSLLICATGEGNLSSGTYPGAGLFQSENNGFTWTPLLTQPGGRELDPAVERRSPRRVASIAFGAPRKDDPRRPVAFASVSKDDSLFSGLFLDYGATGLDYIPFAGNRRYNCWDVVFHPHKPHTFYAAFEPRGTRNGLWRTNNFGTEWVHLHAGDLPAGEHCGRISVAISPSHPHILYALIAGRAGQLLGIFRTDDEGRSWTASDLTPFSSERRLDYAQTIAIHPTDPNYVVVGMINLFRTTDGGRSWQQISTKQRDGGPPGLPPPHFVHADHHALVILDDNTIYAGHDGGVSVTTDSAQSWETRSHGMVTTMFYDLDVCAADSTVFGGGAQDAGTLIAGVRHTGRKQTPKDDPTHFTRVLGGDGGWLVFDPANPLRVFASTADSLIERHDPGQPFANNQLLGGWTNVTPDLSREERALRALTILAFRPRKSRHELWLGTSRLWRYDSRTAAWQPASHFFDGSAISAIEFSPLQPDLILIATTNGAIFRSTDDGLSWSADLAGPDIPRRVITQIRLHPANPRHVYIAVGSSTSPAVSIDGDPLPYSHVFESPDQGDTWFDIDEGALPNVVYNGLAVEPDLPHRLFAAGDAGVWARQNGDWINISCNLPNVIVSDLVFHARDRILTAATYGRGIWRLPVPRRAFRLEPRVGLSPDQLAAADCPAKGYILLPAAPRPVLLDPPDGFVTDVFPRKIILAWSKVRGASGYVVQMVTGPGSFTVGATRNTAVEADHHSAGPVQWRVWALFPDGRHSLPSAPREIKFLN